MRLFFFLVFYTGVLFATDFKCAGTFLDREALNTYFPPNIQVASLFAGAAVVESRLGEALNTKIDVYDNWAPQTLPSHVDYTIRDLLVDRKKTEPLYDRVLLVNPWVQWNQAKIKTAVNFTASRIIRELENSDELSPQNQIEGPEVSKKILLNYYIEREKIVAQVLANILKSIQIAQRWLKPNGKIYLFTELLTILPFYRNAEVRCLYQSPAVTSEAVQMLKILIPNIQIIRNPPGLKNLLIRNGDQLHNPHPEAAIEMWELSF